MSSKPAARVAVPAAPKSRPRKKKRVAPKTRLLRRPQKQDDKKRTHRKRKAVRLLKVALRDHGWTQADLARELGVSKSTVTRWLSGERLPNRDHISALYKLFDDVPPAAWM